MADGTLPRATVVVPTRNEASTIATCLRAILAQDYPRDRYDVVVVDGRSDDGTREIVTEIARRAHVPITLVDNPAGTIPAALNHALARADAEYFVRVDGHSSPAADYVRTCVEAAERLGAGLAGGWVHAVGTTSFGRAVAAAVASPWSTGNAASWREPSAPLRVVSVPCGGYRIAALREIGGFDEAQHANQDYEANIRLADAGWAAYLLPGVSFTYETRSTPWRLARQFFRYGYYRARTMMKHPRSVRARHLAPPLAVVLALALVAAAFIWTAAAIALGAAALAYLAGIAVASVQARAGLTPKELALLPVAFATMHFAWGGGTLVGVVRWLPQRRRIRRR